MKDISGGTASHDLIAPHGGHLNWSVETDRIDSTDMPEIELSRRNLADLDLITTGVYSPLRGFLSSENRDSVIRTMRLTDGSLWPIPITLASKERPRFAVGERVALRYAGEVVGFIEVSEIYKGDLQVEALAVYGTTSRDHPGVKELFDQGEYFTAGQVSAVDINRGEFPLHHMTPRESRNAFATRGWSSVVAFQTRNPVHRAHEYLHKVSLEHVDGLFLNPLVGHTKDDDIPADARMNAYQVLLNNYYPRERVILAVYPAAMRYAGPKEAILHAISRRNYGCTHFIVGRDHAGVGSYYGTYAAQEIFDSFDPDEIGIKIMKYEHTFYCQRCVQIVSPRTCPHGPESHLVMSGTKVREMLRDGLELPMEFTRPEVAEVLRLDIAKGSAS